MRSLPGQWSSRPRAVLVVSAHWEEPDFTVLANPLHKPVRFFEDGQRESCIAQWQCTGSPILAIRVRSLLAAAGFRVKTDDLRGLDGGAYVPLSQIFPKADVPVVQLSLRSDLEPETHLACGRALAPLRKEGVLILASGMSCNGLTGGTLSAVDLSAASGAFDQWLRHSLFDFAGTARLNRLAAWASAPCARWVHPREEHLIPLMVALGAACDEPADLFYHERRFLGAAVISGFQFGTCAPM
ncbi:MAG TPA: class III extradiol ring-cleavage dioxygenase [Burkholderiaceae bacterium]|nr:class III extradiol ring-cleavage dioxygenase [Burkholderiaceae bacterium]